MTKGTDASWVAAWLAPTMSMASASGPAPVLGDVTLRTVLAPGFAGSTVRLRFSNRLGTDDLCLRSVSIGRSPGPSAMDAASSVAVRFGGSDAITLARGTSILSDPISQPIIAGEAVAVTFHVPSSPGPATGHRTFGPAHGTTSIADGDRTMEIGGETAFGAAFGGSLFLTGLDVLAINDGAIVTLGDSITEGAAADRTYSQVLAARLASAPDAPRLSVVNAGVGGDAVRGVLGQRLGPDVLEVTGVAGVILMIGTNDIGGGQAGLDAPTAGELFESIDAIAGRLRAAGLTVWISPITPAGDSSRPAVFVPHYSDPRRVAVRQALNAAVRASDGYDEAIDFDRALRDSANPEHIPVELSGDNLHPTGAGQVCMADSVDLTVFDRLDGSSPST